LAGPAATAGNPIFAPIPAGIVPQLTPEDVDLPGRHQYVDAIRAGNVGELLVVRDSSLTVVDKAGQPLVMSPELTDTGKILSASADDTGYSFLIRTGDHAAEIRTTVSGQVWNVVASLTTKDDGIIAFGWLKRDVSSDPYFVSLKYQSGANFSRGSLYSVNAADGTTVTMTVPSDGDLDIVGPIYRVGTSLVIMGQMPASVETVKIYRSSDNGETWTFEQQEIGARLQAEGGPSAATIDKEFLLSGHGGEGDVIKFIHPAIGNPANAPGNDVTQASLLAPGYAVDETSGPATLAAIVDLGEGSYGVLLQSSYCPVASDSCRQRRDVLVWQPTGEPTGVWQHVTTGISL